MKTLMCLGLVKALLCVQPWKGSKDWAARVRCTDEIKHLLLALDKQSFAAQTKKNKRQMCRRLGSRGSREGLSIIAE